MEKELNLTVFSKYLWHEPNLLVVFAQAPKLPQSREVYNQRYGIEPYAPASEAILMELLTAVGLCAFSLADLESWGWSLNLPGASSGYFIGAEPEGMLCGRVVEADARADASVVQRQKGAEPVTQSHYTVESNTPTAAIEEYFTKVLQLETSVAVDTDGSGVLVQTLPGGRLDPIAGLEPAALLDKIRQLLKEGQLEPLKEAVFFYECRCNTDRINEMLASLPEEKQAEIWGDHSELDIECPRCGREYVVRKVVKQDSTVN